jgi:hypothetical protein
MSCSFETKNGPGSEEPSTYFLLNLMRCPKDRQDTLAAAMDAYLRGIYHCGEFKLLFHHLAIAKENPEIIVSFQGYPTAEDAKHYWNVSFSLMCTRSKQNLSSLTSINSTRYIGSSFRR